MKRVSVLLIAASLSGLATVPTHASDRYRTQPPVVVSPDMSAPWVIQLGRSEQRKPVRRLRTLDTPGIQVQPAPRANRRQATGIFRLFVRDDPDPAPLRQPRATRQRETFAQPDGIRTAAFPVPVKKEMQTELDPIYLPQQVDYDGPGAPGNIVIDSGQKFLYLVQPNGKARRYGVGVGKEGMGWTGTETVTDKKVWPTWRPPAEMIAREADKGRILPAQMDGGPANPLGARALYLGDTLYRIHGTNAPWTIGTNVSSGCIRLRNEDVTDLYERVDVGTKVIVM